MTRPMSKRAERSQLRTLSPNTIEWKREKAAQDFADLLRELLQESGLTCQELSIRSGLAPAHVALILTHRTVPTLKTIAALMAGLQKDFKIVPSDVAIAEGVA